MTSLLFICPERRHIFNKSYNAHETLIVRAFVLMGGGYLGSSAVFPQFCTPIHSSCPHIFFISDLGSAIDTRTSIYI